MSKGLELVPQQVFHRQFGEGGRAVMGVHCSLAHSGAWRGVAVALEAERGSGAASLLAFDLLSHGKSPDWDGHGLLQQRNAQAGLALIAAQAEASGGPVDLVGHSFGATVALAMAQARPDLVRSLVMIEPVLFAAAAREEPEAMALLREEDAAVQAHYEAGDVEMATRLFNRIWGTGQPKWPDLPVHSRGAMVRAFPAVAACASQIYDDAAGILAPGALEDLQMPVMIIQGGATHPIMPVVTRALRRRLPEAAVRVIAGAGHMVPVTHPKPIAAQLAGFWTRGA